MRKIIEEEAKHTGIKLVQRIREKLLYRVPGLVEEKKYREEERFLYKTGTHGRRRWTGGSQK